MACERALERGAEVVFVDNRAIVVEGPTDLDTALGELIDLRSNEAEARATVNEPANDERRGNAVTEKGTKTPTS